MGYSCLFCKKTDIEVSLRRRPVHYLILQKFYYCKGCTGYSLWPSLSVDQINKMYSVNYIEDVNCDDFDEITDDLRRFSDLRNFLVKLSSEDKNLRLLDFGCGADAQVLRMSHGLGISATGVELDEATREKAILNSSFPVLSFQDLLASNQKFDVIFLGDLIEHVYDPSDLISVLKESLSDGGSFFIQGPLEGAKTVSNFLLGFKARLNHATPSTLPPYHVSLASFESMQRLLRVSGLEVIELIIREPLWPAKAFGSKDSFSSFSDFIFSLSKLFDMAISRFFRNYGTRIYCVAKTR